jgi:2-C-methyl-D-erythritol 4-phosphate cytidylyltransferase
LPTAVVVPAAGRGDRLGGGEPKALRRVGDVPLLVHAVDGLGRSGSVDVVVVAAPPGHVATVERVLRDGVPSVPVAVVEGGATRQQSVAAALAVLEPDIDIVLVHDAARAFTPPEVVTRVVQAVRDGAPAVVPALPVTDTVKRVCGEAGDVVEGTLDRTFLRAVQTPQGFRRDVLGDAHRADDAELAAATDDASLLEALGIPVTVVPGSDEAFKVTRPIDLLLAEALVRRRAADPGPPA